MKKCMDLYRNELRAMPDAVLDWELEKLNYNQFRCKNEKK